MPSLRPLAAVLGLVAAACAAPSSATSDDDLTSVTGRARKLELGGTVYVEEGAADDAILAVVRAQTQTAFGPLRTSQIAVNSRELKGVDPATFVKRVVDVVDTDAEGAPSKKMLEVRYTYRDDAVVSAELASRSQIPLALLGPDYKAQAKRIIKECTADDAHAREFEASAWYVFEPRLPGCQEAMRAEQAKIEADRGKLTDKGRQVTKSDATRLYLPIQVQLGADTTNQAASYPDYARLFRGGVQKDKLVVGLVQGFIDDDQDGARPAVSDYNWGELMTTLGELMDAQGDFALVAPPPAVPANLVADLRSFKLPSGKMVDGASFADLVRVHRGGSRLALEEKDRADLEKQFADRLSRKWIALERPVRVRIGDEAERDFAIQVLVYFGADVISGPHKLATKNSDVFLYNGHSSIGYGPLDPKYFTPADFAQDSYQLFWIDSCVSYNYYEKDYFPLKQGGSKDLDLITNGVEAPSYRSGHAMGQFLIALLGGQASYRELLLAAKDTESLRVVDGELDNTFRPEATPVRISPR